MKKFTANPNAAWCAACKRLHLSTQKVMYE